MFTSWQPLWRRILTVPVGRPRRRPFKKPTARLVLECLENRLVPSTFVVSNTHDSGTNSLRWAITSANAATGQTNTIDFNLGGNDVILPASALPAITYPVVIDGLSNPTTHMVVLAGGNASGGANGLVLQANGCTVEGLDIISFKGNGLLIDSDENTVVSNSFGLLFGSYADPNGNGIGIQGLGADSNTIGGTTAADANIIAGNHGDGLFIDGGQNNVVVGNFIGTNSHSAAGFGNGLDGIHVLDDATENNIGELTVGGPVVGNVISDNGRFGVEISGGATNSNFVAGNEIGTNQAGTQALGNHLAGVMMDLGTSDNVIGGSLSTDANTISGNGTGVVLNEVNGVFGDNFIEGNMIGTNAAGTARIPNDADGVDIENGADLNAVFNNVISGNKANGVALFGIGTTGNVLTGNMVGTNANGSAALPNGSDGVDISDQASGNTLGGSGAANANVISGNDVYGVAIDFGATDNTVAGNLIGVNQADTQSLGHQQIGVGIYGNANANYVGTTSAEGAIGNVISGNTQDGVGIFNEANGNFVQANEIGTDQTGMVKIGNGQNGVYIEAGADDNHVGSGTVLGTNIISGNGLDGVYIADNSAGNTVAGNTIGADANQSKALGNGHDGVNIEQASNNTIGGPLPGDADVIAGNGYDGVVIGTQAYQNYVENDFIGTTAGSAAVMPNQSNGVFIAGGSNGNFIGNVATAAEHTVALANVIAGNLGDGVLIYGPGTNSNTVEADDIGTNQGGTAVMPNQQTGVVIEDGAEFNTIGAQSPDGADVISGNAADGVVITGSGTSGNQVEGSDIGTNRAGNAALPNGNNGVALAGGATANVIGGTFADQGNVIAGNAVDGVELRDPGTDFNRIWNNFVGIASDSITPVPNVYGIYLFGGASNNTIGGVDSANVIADNIKGGVILTGNNTLGNTISQNSIFGNGGLGIDLGNNGVTPNGSGPFGPNMYQNYPVLSAGASPGTITVTLTTGMPDTSYTIELFSSGSSSPNQGQNFLTSVTVTTDSSGVATYTYTLGAEVNATYPYVTATATDATGDTSEFSAPLLVTFNT